MAAPLPPGVRIDRDLVIPLADGTRLAGDLYRPAAAGPVPVLVSYYPYRKDDIIGSLFEGTRLRLCERGYASVFADMTGTGASEGDYGESFDLAREGRDAAEIIEWAAGQDWCDGNVGAWGVSYGGMTALAAAAQHPAHLRAIIAVYATTDIYRDTIAPGGCPAMLGRYAWAAHMMALGLCPPTRPDPDGRWRQTWTRRLRRLTGGPSHAVTWQAHPGRDAYWQGRVIDAKAIGVPAMLIGGWADMFKDAMLSLYGAVTGPKRLVMGPWMHVLPHLSRVEPYDWAGEMADWWDEHLRRPPAPPRAPRDPVLFFAQGQGWRSARQWPPDGTRPLRLFPAGYGLDRVPPDAPGHRDYAGDAAIGVASGMWDPFGTGNGWPEEQSGDDARSAAFTSEPLPAPLLVAGRPEADLYLTREPGQEGHLAARLAMVGPDGRSTLITTGWHPLPAVGVTAPDGPERVTITLGTAAFALPAGTRLRLSVACADFPRIWPSAANPAIRLCFGASSPSELRVPVCTADRRRDTPASVPGPPATPDTGWVTDGEPLYLVSHDKAADEVAVTFGARTRLRPPSGADLKLDERFTARVRPGRPAGAALTAEIGIGVRLPAGERVEVVVRSTSSRTATVVEGRVTLDGTSLLHHRWTSQDGPAAAQPAPDHLREPPGTGRNVELLGYAQPGVTHAGEIVDVKVSTTQPGFTAEVVRLGLDATPAVPEVAGTFPGRRQELIRGSYLIADLGDEPGASEYSVQFWFFPTLLAERQCLMAGFAAAGGWEVGIGEDRRLRLARLSAQGDVLASASAGPEIQARRWYFATASWDAAGAVTLASAARDPRRPDLAAGHGSRHELGGTLPAASVITVGAAVPDGRPLRCFNGKVDTPRVFTGALTPAARRALAADAPASRVGGLRHEWRLGPEAARPPHRVPDDGPGRRDAALVNMPTLGVTGRNWTAATESFAAAPEQYRAAHFHSDDLSDAGWQTDLSFEVPAGWPSGVYAIRLRSGPHEDMVPLIVSAAGIWRGTGQAAAAVLLPTFSYLAYANEHASWERPIKASVGGAGSLVVTDRDRYTSEQRLLSLYELHADGSGTCLSSWRRPVLNMRPGYDLPLVRGPHQFSADLELLQWLEGRGVDFDVITDDDLHRHGAAALDRYRVVLTGSHPEYVSRPMLDGLDSYLAAGGRLMYLGGNGFYWVTTAPADDPFVIEVRRGMAGTRVWESPPGEWHQAMTGEHGGLWRHRGRPPQALAGVGFTAQGFDRSLPYQINAAMDERARFIIEGIDPGAPLGGTGSVLGGPAGFEIDRADPALGTPANTVLVASARGFSDAYQGAVEDITTADSQQGGTVSDLVRSDVVFFETGTGGAVFSVGSIAWCGALRDSGQETPAGRMTWNVLSRFLDETPFVSKDMPPGTDT